MVDLNVVESADRPSGSKAALKAKLKKVTDANIENSDS